MPWRHLPIRRDTAGVARCQHRR